MSGGAVKRERGAPAPAEDRELDEWARQLANRPTPQIGNNASQGQSGGGGGGGSLTGGQQGTLNNFLVQNQGAAGLAAGIGPDGIPFHNGFDRDSALGRFGWHTVGGDKYIPVVYRCGERFCAVRMAEISVIGEELKYLPVEIYESISVSSYAVTSVEVRHLNQINSWHCDGFYGPEPFTLKDQLVRVSDIEKFYEFITFAFDTLHYGGRNDARDFSKCAFLKVNTTNIVPYTVLPTGEKAVPLFYFEGQTDILKNKAEHLGGWELAYLKICCKVQGVRKELIAGSTLLVVKVSDLKTYFPKKTTFQEEYWPEPKSKSLLLVNQKGNGTNMVGFQTVSANVRWALNTPYKNPDAPPGTMPAGGLPQPPLPQLVSKPPQAAVASTSSSAPPPNPSSSINSTNRTSYPNSVINTRNGGNSVNSTNNNNNTSVAVRIVNGAQVTPTQYQAGLEYLKRIKVVNPPPPIEIARLHKMPEFSYPQRREQGNPFTVRRILMDKELLHCINMNAYRDETYLISVQQFMERFFPNVSIYPTAVSVLKDCGVGTYLPNQAQIRALNASGFDIQFPWQLPLAPVMNLSQSMRQLQQLFRPRLSRVLPNNNANSSRTSNGYVHAIR